MLVALLMAAATAAPSPTASASAAPLKTIVTVKTSAFCTQFATHVNSAIDSAAANDATLGSVMLTLKTNGLSGTTLARVHEKQRLWQMAGDMYKAYRDGEGQVIQLRALETQTTDPDEKSELKAAADALGGALYRQHLIQRDLDGFVAYLDASDMSRDPMQDDDDESNLDVINASGPRDGLDARYGIVGPMGDDTRWLQPGREARTDDVLMAEQAADDFATRRLPIMGDELRAAGHIGNVSGYCL